MLFRHNQTDVKDAGEYEILMTKIGNNNRRVNCPLTISADYYQWARFGY